MWELDHKEGWTLKNWCFWTVVLEKTLESPLDTRISNHSILKETNPDYFIGRTDAEASILWSPDRKSQLIGKDSDARRDWGQKEKGTTEDEMAGWHHGLDDYESEWTPGVGDGQGGLACCNLSGRRVRHNWATELNWTDCLVASVTEETPDVWWTREWIWNPNQGHITLDTSYLKY